MAGALLQKSIRVATFNAALFSLVLAVPKSEKSVVFINEDEDYSTINKSLNNRPKSILKQSPLHPSLNVVLLLLLNILLTRLRSRNQS